MAGLRTDVELGYEDALSSVDRIGSGLDDVVARFSESLAAALDTASSQPIVPTVDTTAFEEGLAAALATADEVVVPVSADTSPAEADVAGLEAGIASQLEMFPVDADVAPAEATVEGLVSQVDGQQAAIQVDADTSEAQAAVEDLSGATDGLDASSTRAAGSVHENADATAVLAGSAGLARGEVGGLNEVAHGLGGTAAAGAVGVGAIGVATLEFFHAGVQAVGAGQRFNTILGDMADEVERVRIGDLDADLGHLGIQFGSTDAEMKNAAASVFQFGVNGGKSREESAKFTQELVGLSARAVSLNPNLGTLSDVTESLSGRIARGGRFAAAYGLSLSAAEINARALVDTGKDNASELTIQEKAFAAAEIASGRYGSGLKDTVADGAKNALNEQKSLEAQLKEVVETLGAPLVSPVFRLMDDARPIVDDLGRVLLDVSTAALPALDAGLSLVEPPLHLLADVMDALPRPIVAVGTALVALRLGLGPVASWAGSGSAALSSLFTVTGSAGTNLAKAGAGALVAGAGFQAAGEGGVQGAIGVGQMALGGAMLGAQLGAITPLGPVAGAAIGAVGGAAVGIARDVLSSGESIDEYRQKFEKLGSTLDGITSKAALSKFVDQLGDTDKLAVAAGDVRGFSDELTALATTSPAAAQKVVAAYAQMQEQAGHPLSHRQIDELNAAVSAGTEKYKANTVAAQDSAAKNQQVAASASAASQAETDQAAASKAAADATAAHSQALSETTTRYQQTTLAAQTQAQADANAVGIAQQQAAASRSAADGQAAYAQSQLAYTVAVDGSVAAAGRFESGQASAKEALDAESGAVAALRTQLTLLEGNYLSMLGSTVGLRTSIDQFNDTLGKQNNTLGDNALAVDASQTALVQMGNAALSAAQANAQNGASVTEQIAPLLQYQAELDQVKAALSAAGDTAGVDFVQKLEDANQRAITNLQSSTPGFQAAGSQAAGGAVQGVADQQGAMSGAGSAVGGAGTGGFAAGISGMPGTASGTVLDSVNAAQLAGANAHNVGYGIGASFSAGIGDGIIANDGYVQAQARQVVQDAEGAARSEADSHSPSRLFAALGQDLALGVAVGLREATPDVAGAARSTITTAAGEAASRRFVPYLPRSAVFPTATAPAAGGAPAGTEKGAGAAAGGHSIVVHNHLHVKADKDTPKHVVREQADEYGDRVGAATVRAVIGAL